MNKKTQIQKRNKMEKENKDKYIHNNIERIRKNVSYITTDDAFLKKIYRKISQEKGYDVLRDLLKNSVEEYRDTRKELVRNEMETKKYDKKVSDITSKLSFVPVNFE